MPKTYYDFTSNEPYPPMVLSIVEAIRYHYSVNVLYKDEDYDTVSKLRWLLADGTTSMQMRGSTKQFNWSNAKFPFTAYTIGDIASDERMPNFYARSHRYYSEVYDRIISANASVFELTMYTFFTNALDYHRAQTLLRDDDALKTMAEVPVTINSELTSFPIIIDPEIIKGNLAYEFEQQLKAGNIFDINHSIKIYYHDLIVNDSTAPRNNAFVIAPVDNIQVAIKDLTFKKLGQTVTYASGNVVTTPDVSSTIPLDTAEDVAVTINPILNFSVAMNKSSVEANLEFIPGINADYVWNTDQTQLTLSKISNFVSGTAYSVSLAKKAESVYGQIMKNDYDFTFTTI